MIRIENPPEILIEISAPYSNWTNGFEPENFIRRALTVVFDFIPLPKDVTQVEVSILLANDDLIRTLNRDYRGKDSPTNVLSFPQLDLNSPINAKTKTEADNGRLMIGDMVFSYETVMKESKEKIYMLEGHFCHLVIHSALHLLGYTHDDEENANLMEDIEIMMMAELGYQNPYLWNDMSSLD